MNSSTPPSHLPIVPPRSDRETSVKLHCHVSFCPLDYLPTHLPSTIRNPLKQEHTRVVPLVLRWHACWQPCCRPHDLLVAPEGPADSGVVASFVIVVVVGASAVDNGFTRAQKGLLPIHRDLRQIRFELLVEFDVRSSNPMRQWYSASR